jgi:UDP-N-acetylglucosamine/UDP-N-acetylgalactosamine diphosphorylase
MALRDNKPHIVEYSEIDDKTAKAVDVSSGRLTFGSGNICNHFYTLDFIKNKAVPALSSSYHVAHKKIPHADPETGETVKPTKNNGIKLELFIFDVFPLAEVSR